MVRLTDENDNVTSMYAIANPLRTSTVTFMLHAYDPLFADLSWGVVDDMLNSVEYKHDK